MKSCKEHEPSKKLVEFLAKALKQYTIAHPHISHSALAKKINIELYSLIKIGIGCKKKSSLKPSLFNIEDIWKILDFLRHKDILDPSLTEEFKSCLMDFLHITSKNSALLSENLWKNQENSVYCFSSKKDDEKKNKKRPKYRFVDFEFFLIFQICDTPKGARLEVIDEILGLDSHSLVTEMEEMKLITVKNGRAYANDIDFEADLLSLKNFIHEMQFKFFRKTHFGKGRSAAGCGIGSFNDEGLIHIYSLTRKYIKAFAKALKNEDFSGDIPVGFTVFTDALIHQTPERKRWFSRQKKNPNGI